MMKCIGIAIGIVTFLVILFIQSAVVAALLAAMEEKDQEDSKGTESETNNKRK